MGIVYKVFVGADNVDRGLALARGEVGHEGPGAPPVMNLLDWNCVEGSILLTATDGARFIADSFNAKIEHAGYFTRGNHWVNDDEKRVLAKMTLQDDQYFVKGQFVRVGSPDEELFSDGYPAVIGDEMLFLLEPKSQEIIEWLVENEIDFTLEGDYENVEDVNELAPDDPLREHGEWAEYGTGSWYINIH